MVHQVIELQGISRGRPVQLSKFSNDEKETY